MAVARAAAGGGASCRLNGGGASCRQEEWGVPIRCHHAYTDGGSVRGVGRMGARLRHVWDEVFDVLTKGGCVGVWCMQTHHRIAISLGRREQNKQSNRK